MGDGLSGLFREQNPYDRGIKTTGAVMGDSGFAKPFLAMAMGGDVANANAWDQERDQEARAGMAANMSMLRDKQAHENFSKEQEHVLEFVKVGDLEAASKLANAMATSYPTIPAAQVYKGITFTKPLNKDGIGEVKDGEGQPWAYDINKLFKGEPNAVVKVGEPAPDATLKTRTYQKGGLEVTEEFDPTSGTWKEIGSGPKWNPKDSGSGNDMAKTDKIKAARQTYNQKWFSVAKSMIPNLDIREITDPASGQINYDLVRGYLPQKLQGAYDNGLVETENNAGSVVPSKAAEIGFNKHVMPALQSQGPLQSLATGPEVPLSAAPKTQHPLTGREAGIYRVDGRVVKWDGSRELQ